MKATGYTVGLVLCGRKYFKAVYCLIVAAILLNVLWVFISNTVISPFLQGPCNFEQKLITCVGCDS